VTLPAEVIQLLRDARRVVALTGAGISAESGVPTFRDALTGLWEKYRPEDLATPEAFLRRPALVWEWYAWRHDLVRGVQPNAGHFALARLAQRYPSFTLITQNVDSLHQRAGSGEVIELHGSLSRVKCFEQSHAVETWDAQVIPPRCPICDSLLRPDVVWFGEPLPAAALDQAFKAAQSCDVLLAIGTSGLVYPAAGIPLAALELKKAIVEINTGRTPLSDRATHFLQGPAGEVLPGMLEALS